MVVDKKLRSELVHLEVEREMINSGYLTQEYIHPKKQVVTEVKCPICGNKLILFVVGYSYKIKCNIENCYVSTCRGI